MEEDLAPGKDHTEPEQAGRRQFLGQALITRREAEPVAVHTTPRAQPVEPEVKAGLDQMVHKEEKVPLHVPLRPYSVMPGWAQMGQLRPLVLIPPDHLVVVVVVEAAGQPTTQAPVFGV